MAETADRLRVIAAVTWSGAASGLVYQRISAAQLGRLTAVAAQPNADLQILPLAAGPRPATTGEFTILSFPQLIAPDVVYPENMTSDLYVEQEADVYRYTMAFDRLRGLALTPEESAAMITTRAETIG